MLSPNSGISKKYVIEPLKKQNRAAFYCGNPLLDKYLKEQASQDMKKFAAAPFVLIDTNYPNTVIGYYTLSSTNILLNELPSEIQKKLPRYPNVPATLLGRLARDIKYRGEKLGKILLMDALNRTLKSEIATAAIVVEAIDDKAILFYEDYNFIKFPNKPNLLFMHKQNIIEIFQ